MKIRSTLVIVALGLGGCGANTTAPPARDGGNVPASCARGSALPVAADSWSATHRQLAPPGAAAIRLCRYNGLNSTPPLSLARSVLVTAPATVALLVRELDELPPFAPGGVLGCPMDDGSLVTVLLAYPAGRRAAVAIHLAGCLTVANGSVTRTALGPGDGGQQLHTLVKRLTGWHAPVY